MNNSRTNAFVLATILALGLGATATSHAQEMAKPMDQAMAMPMTSMTGQFKGVEVHGGSVSFKEVDGKATLMLSADFKTPKTPAPTWQVIDAEGNTYLLKQLNIAGGKMNRSVVLPKYIKSVAKVQIWCSFAEVVLGEASFEHPVMCK